VNTLACRTILASILISFSRGGATVILAMGDGKKTAAAIHEYLRSNVPAPR